MYRFQRLFRTGNLSEDVARRLCPDEGLGVGVMVLKVMRMIALSSSATLLKVPRRMRFSVILAKKRSTMLSHDDEPYLIERAYVLFSQVGIAAAARSGQGLVAGRSHKPDMAIPASWLL